MVRCLVLVVVKPSGADKDSTNRTQTTTRFQKTVCGTLVVTVWSCAYGWLVLSGIVQCFQCHKWSHNACVQRPAKQSEGQLAVWTCEKCDVDIARELHLCRSRRCSLQTAKQEDHSDGAAEQVEGLNAASLKVTEFVCLLEKVIDRKGTSIYIHVTSLACKPR